MYRLSRDLRFALRQLWKDKGFTLTVVLTLALCIGANTAIFSVVDSVILEPLPFEESDRLVRMWNSYPNAGALRGANSIPDYYDRRGLTGVFQEVATWRSGGMTLSLGDAPRRVRTMRVTPSLFPLLRVEAEVGRTFTEQEHEPGDDQVAVLSHGLAEELYGEARQAVGNELRMSGRVYTVVGVMPADFHFMSPEVRLWVPDAFPRDERDQYHSNSWNMIGRLQPGVSLEQAQQQIDALNDRVLDRVPFAQAVIDAGFHTPVAFFQEDMVRDVRGMLFMLWGGVLFVLLIGTVNLANLTLVRSTARVRELATRFALGARHWQVSKQLLTESLLNTAIGGILGLGAGWLGVQALGVLGTDQLPRGSELALDGAAVLWTAGLTLAIGVLLGLIPVVGVLRLDVASAFRDEGRSGTAGRGTRILRRGLVVAQVAFALILLVGAGLLLASFWQILSVDPGFEPEGVVSGIVVPPSARYENDAAVLAFADEVLEEIRALPGVQEAMLTDAIPFGGSYSDSVIMAEGYVPAPGESLVSPDRTQVSAGFFETLGIPLLEGRTFDSRDTADSQPAIIIDRQLADRFWPDGDALGKRMFMPASAEDLLDTSGATMLTIVGIVGSIRRDTLEDPGELDVGAYYLPMRQNPFRGMDVAVKTAGDPASIGAALRRTISEIDPELPLFDVRTLQERIDDTLVARRSPMILTLAFAALALFLAALGIYGVLAYLVSLRTRELGVRMALGSGSRRVFRLVLQEGMTILAIGLALGLAGALALRRGIESQLYGVSVLDPLVLTGVVVLLGSVAAIACAIPARRATRIDPVVALSAK